MLANEFQLTPKYCQQSFVISLLLAKAFNINLFKISVIVYKTAKQKKKSQDLRS
jgi:hypothetical protein